MTEFIFFSGKGGVGKTSMACMHAVRHADNGKHTLIVTTDPASNLADVFEQKIGHHITPITGLTNLWAMEIDPDKSTQEYVERALAPVRTAFPASMVNVIEEQMSGPCTAEVAAFDRFTDFFIQDQSTEQFDIVIFDTAPTGHTIRLLELPADWSQSIDAASAGSGQTCIGPAAAIQNAKHKYEHALAVLRDEELTTFIFVLHPEAIAIRETQRAINELGKLGIHTHRLIVNGIIPATEQVNPLFSARSKMQSGYLEQIRAQLPFPSQYMPLLSNEIKGIEQLRQVAKIFFDAEPTPVDASKDKDEFSIDVSSSSMDAIRARIQPNGQPQKNRGISPRRTIFFTGKGGVGKTVASCITAIWLAQQGYKTLLLTTDPAAHLEDVLGQPVGVTAEPLHGLSNLWAVNIDPKAAAETYKARILNEARQRGRTESAINVMQEELNSPCTEEMAAFDQFIDYASQTDWEAVVFDTAPTGHTMRLLELPMDWSQQIDVKVFASVDGSAADDVAKKRFGQVIKMMRDPEQSTFAFVMYPEATPILEAWRAAQELATVGIQPGLVVANFVIPPEQSTPFAQARQRMQNKYLAEIRLLFAVPVLKIPLLPLEVKGLEMLAEMGELAYGSETIMVR